MMAAGRNSGYAQLRIGTTAGGVDLSSMTPEIHGPAGQVLRGIRHGGEVLPDDARDAKPRVAAEPGTELASTALASGVPLPMAAVEAATTPFDYLFRDLMHDPDAHLQGDPEKVRADLRTLGAAMVEPVPGDPVGDSTIPPIHTYLGQFVDHDLTANTDRANALGHVSDADLHPMDPDEVAEKLRNLRLPALNLDSVYGDGPGPGSSSADQYDGILLRVGRIALAADDGKPPLRGVRIPLEADLDRDLPRDESGRPLIGDGRNDENLIVAQLHTAFLRAHNAAVRWVRTHEPDRYDDGDVFRRAQQLVRWHYQWIVLHDYLPTVALPGVVDEVLLDPDQRLYAPRHGRTWMPLEFSIAAFRFGHTMVRGAYDYNRNFGRGAHVIPSAPFGLLFLFTGRGGFAGATGVLPFNWVIEWDRFVSPQPRFGDRTARRIDTVLAPPLQDLSLEVTGLPVGTPDEIRIVDILRMLAVRNLLRGYQLSVPTGQAVATRLGLTPLTSDELRQGNSDAVNLALAGGGFTERTPLWYYVLKEAEVRADGNSLGELGSRIVAETIVGQVRHDDEAYLAHGWTPEEGLRTADDRPVRTITDLLRFAGVLPTRG